MINNEQPTRGTHLRNSPPAINDDGEGNVRNQQGRMDHDSIFGNKLTCNSRCRFPRLADLDSSSQAGIPRNALQHRQVVLRRTNHARSPGD